MMTKAFEDGVALCEDFSALNSYILGGIQAALSFEKDNLECLDTIRAMMKLRGKHKRRIMNETVPRS